jgi:hypothetical protein
MRKKISDEFKIVNRNSYNIQLSSSTLKPIRQNLDLFYDAVKSNKKFDDDFYVYRSVQFKHDIILKQLKKKIMIHESFISTTWDYDEVIGRTYNMPAGIIADKCQEIGYELLAQYPNYFRGMRNSEVIDEVVKEYKLRFGTEHRNNHNQQNKHNQQNNPIKNIIKRRLDNVKPIDNEKVILIIKVNKNSDYLLLNDSEKDEDKDKAENEDKYVYENENENENESENEVKRKSKIYYQKSKLNSEPELLLAPGYFTFEKYFIDDDKNLFIYCDYHGVKMDEFDSLLDQKDHIIREEAQEQHAGNKYKIKYLNLKQRIGI